MNITACIKKIYPAAEFGRDFIVQSNGRGVYIAKWTYTQQQPTQIELEAVYPQVLKEQKIKEFTQKAYKELSVTDYKITRQIEQNTLSATDYAALKLARQSIRDKCNALKAEVNDVNKSVAEIEAVVW